MRDEPEGPALLESARQSLLDDVVPGLTGRPRYVALMVANALGIAAREIRASDRSAAAWAAVLATDPDGGSSADVALARLVAAIRAGRHDADRDLHAALLETARVAAAIFRPED